MSLIRKYVGRKWSKSQLLENKRHWWTSSALSAHIDRRICPKYETGVRGLLRETIGTRPLEHGISIGSGNGAKEIRLLKSDLVNHFTLYEISTVRAKAAIAAARAEGLSKRVNVRVANAFSEKPQPVFDLVYWDHALHHMMDVGHALKWSQDSLRPGGILLINDYVGPPRLQWSREEVDRARAFLTSQASFFTGDPPTVRYKTTINRWKQMIDDPSEAPQSDKIEKLINEDLGIRMNRIGGAMIHLCASHVLAVTGQDEHHPLLERLIWSDLQALECGYYHFASGVWVKPGFGK
jgi:SAM-dependent methyltransferase